MAALPKRVARFGLTLHPEKTRLVQFQRPRSDDSDGEPGSFDFLGLTHYWGRSRKGYWIPKRKTARKRFTRALRTVVDWLKKSFHLPLKRLTTILGQKLKGHYLYYGIRGNSIALGRFFYQVNLALKKCLGRRSQRAKMTWDKYNRLLKRHPLPYPRIDPGYRQMRLVNP